jgi:hypothetical protein
MSHALKSVRECERMNLHTPKWAPTLGVGIPMDSQIFREKFQGLKPFDWEIFYIIRKILELRCLTWVCMTHLDTSNTNYGQKKGWESNCQLTPNHKKSRITPISLCAGGVLHTLESSQQRLQLCVRPYLNQRFAHKVMGPQSCESPNFGNFGTPTWDS